MADIIDIDWENPTYITWGSYLTLAEDVEVILPNGTGRIPAGTVLVIKNDMPIRDMSHYRTEGGK